MKANRLLLVVLFLFGSVHGAVAAGPEDSIVRVTSVLRLPNPVRPWTKQNPMEVGGTGVVIDGKRILTVAHLVLYAEEVYVQPGQGGDRVEAKVAAIAPGIDLAVLTIDPAEGDFFDKRPPLPRAAGCRRSRRAWPSRGSRSAATACRPPRASSRGSSTPTYDTGSMGLRIQVDAAINPGNSGGPALVDGKMVGLVWGSGGGRERRLPHPQRGDRRLPQGRRRRPVRRQAVARRAVADARERGAAGQARAGQGRARDHGPRAPAPRRVLPAQGVRRRHRDRRQGDRQRGDGAGRATTCGCRSSTWCPSWRTTARCRSAWSGPAARWRSACRSTATTTT